MYMNRRLVYGGLNPPSIVNKPNGSTESEVNTTFNWDSVFTKKPNNNSIFRKRSGKNENSKARLQEMKQEMLRETLGPTPLPTPLPIQEKATSKFPSLITYRNKINPNAPLLFSVPRVTRMPKQIPNSLRPNEWDGMMYNKYKQYLHNTPTRISPPSYGLYRQVEIPWKEATGNEKEEKVIVVTFFEKNSNIPVFILQPSWRERTSALYVVDDVKNFLDLTDAQQIVKLNQAALEWDWKNMRTKENKNADNAAWNHAESQFHGGPVKKGGSKKGRKHTRRKHTRRNRSFRR